MAQYLMALLGHRDPFTEMFMRGMGDTTHAGPGRMGDYVFNQEGRCVKFLSITGLISTL